MNEADRRIYRVVVSLRTVVAVMQPDSMAVVLAVAFHGVVGKVALRHLVVGIDHNLRGRKWFKVYRC